VEDAGHFALDGELPVSGDVELDVAVMPAVVERFAEFVPPLDRSAMRLLERCGGAGTVGAD
jgi:hypothetical protein